MLEAKIIEVTPVQTRIRPGVNWAAFRPGRQQPVRRRRAAIPAARFDRRRSCQRFYGAQCRRYCRCTQRSAADPSRSGSAPAALIVAAPAQSPGTVFGLAFQTSNFAALLNFLETQGALQVLSSPRIATLNNQKAVLKVGTDEFFVTNITTIPRPPALPARLSRRRSPCQPFFSGIALDVTPQIDDRQPDHPAYSSVGEPA